MTTAGGMPPPPPPPHPPMPRDRGAARAWSESWGKFCSSPTWLRVVALLIVVPLGLTTAAVAAAAVVTLGVRVVSTDGDAQAGRKVESVTTTTERRTTTTREHQTATTVARAPEGGRRSGNGDDISRDATAVEADQLDRATPSNDLLYVLASLTVEAEHPRDGYARSLFPHWDDEDGDGCDTRCEVLAAQRKADGSWFSEWDGYSTDDPSELHVDHVVALAEAWDSGADRWSAAERDDFADSMPNLLAVSASSNLRKSDKDAAEWFPSRADANCLWASTVVQVKDHWKLAVDRAEADALGNLLRTCADYVPPTTTTTRPPSTTTTRPRTASPPQTTTTAAPPPPPSNCTAGYNPCIPPGSDVDCAGGTGDGPRYYDGPIYVDHSKGDPYGLDRDGDGVACEK